ncbi:MAG TPA: excinuclease ABC subunit A, partial [Verrucomicrobia bacterium]|nr:excinuclease ABC subunit A [Verrucomicrobiota bacterium]
MHAQGNNGPPQGVIRVRNARQHNLQGLNLDIPLEQITVVTGLSGAGKSSLVFDTIYAEGQRRYVETFSSYARQFLDRMDKPLVDAVEGIPPAIAIEQRNSVRTSRSTVGTMTEIADFMKLYMPHVARLFCDGCGREVRHDTPSSVWAELRSSCTEGEPLLVSFEIPRPPTMSWEELAQGLIQQGFLRVWSAGAVLRLDDLASWPKASKSKITKADTVEVIQDRLSVETAAQERFVEAAEAAFRLGHGVLTL